MWVSLVTHNTLSHGLNARVCLCMCVELSLCTCAVWLLGIIWEGGFPAQMCQLSSVLHGVTQDTA